MCMSEWTSIPAASGLMTWSGAVEAGTGTRTERSAARADGFGFGFGFLGFLGFFGLFVGDDHGCSPVRGCRV